MTENINNTDKADNDIAGYLEAVAAECEKMTKAELVAKCVLLENALIASFLCQSEDDEKGSGRVANTNSHDLNALHKAWLNLSKADKLAFHSHLKEIVMRDHPRIEQYAIIYSGLLENATAEQRRKAFLKTVGKS